MGDVMTDEQIGRELFGPGKSSENCAVYLLDLLDRDHDDRTFWRIFNFGWPCCDDIWRHRAKFRSRLKARGAAARFLERENLAFYHSLPPSVEIHRGCSIERVRGLSWTTDRSVASDFARGHRGIRVPNALVATTIIPEDQIFTVITDRGESGVIVDCRQMRPIEMSWDISRRA